MGGGHLDTVLSVKPGNLQMIAESLTKLHQCMYGNGTGGGDGHGSPGGGPRGAREGKECNAGRGGQ